MVQAARSKRLRWMQPLPLVPSGSVRITDGVALLEDEEGGVVFIWGRASFSWSRSDSASRRLAAVQLVSTGVASQRQTSAGFGVNETTLWRWRSDYEAHGLIALFDEKKGPKRPSVLTEEKVDEIRQLRREGNKLREIASLTGVSLNSVQRAIVGLFEDSTPPQTTPGPLEPLAKPADRSAERWAARQGLITEAKPVICEGSHLPFAGALVVLPALAATGLLDIAETVYGLGRNIGGTARAAFYGIRSFMLSIVFACLLGEPRAEGMTRLDPVAIGRLIGLDRAPEVRRLRARMAELAAEGRADKFQMALARRHIEHRPEAIGLLYVDGHVRAYHGQAELPKAHLARMRIAMPAEVDTYVSDRFGDGLLVWQSPPGASLAGELKQVARSSAPCSVTRLARRSASTGAAGRPSSSPSSSMLASTSSPTAKVLRDPSPAPCSKDTSLQTRRAMSTTTCWPTSASASPMTPTGAGSRAARSPASTRRRATRPPIVTTRSDPDPGLVAHAMFSRWRQENFFRVRPASVSASTHSTLMRQNLTIPGGS